MQIIVFCGLKDDILPTEFTIAEASVQLSPVLSLPSRLPDPLTWVLCASYALAQLLVNEREHCKAVGNLSKNKCKI